MVQSGASLDADVEQSTGDATASQAPGPPGPVTPKLERGLLTGQWLWAQGKAMPGVELGLGVWKLEFDLEVSFLATNESSPDFDGTLLGNHLGLYLMFTPLSERLYDLSLGFGADGYLLWGIHVNVSEVALAPRALVRLWPLENLGLSLSARTYVYQSDGVELGTTRDGSTGSPVLLATGLTWRFR